MFKSELEAKIRSIRTRLDEIRQYKRVIAEEGLVPDKDDKRVESELIIRLLRLERELAEKEGRPYNPKGGDASRGGGKFAKARQQSPRGKKEGKRASFGKAKDEARQERDPASKGKGPARHDKGKGPVGKDKDKDRKPFGKGKKPIGKSQGAAGKRPESGGKAGKGKDKDKDKGKGPARKRKGPRNRPKKPLAKKA